MTAAGVVPVREHQLDGWSMARFGERTLEGDAFEQAVRVHGPGAYRLALRLCSDPQRAEDAVAEAFSKVWNQWRKGQVLDLGPYLRRAVVNQVTSGFRRKATEQRWLERRTGDDRGERALDQQAVDAEVFRIALAQLSPRQRAAVVLRYYEDASERDIAEAMGCSPGAVKRHLSRGVARLRDLLAAEGEVRRA